MRAQEEDIDNKAALKIDHKSKITLTQVAATALAAVTAAFLGSRLGLAGTIIGAGLASVVSTVAGALYQHSLDRTSSHMRSRVSKTRDGTDPAAVPTAVIRPLTTPQAKSRRGVRWWMAAALTTLAFVLSIGAVTGYELLHGGPISGGNNGTSIGSLFGQSTEQPTSATPTTTTTPGTTTSSQTTTTTPSTTSPTTTTGQPPTTTTSPLSTSTSVPPTSG